MFAVAGYLTNARRDEGESVSARGSAAHQVSDMNQSAQITLDCKARK